MIPFIRSVQRKQVYTHRKQIKGFLKLLVGTKMNYSMKDLYCGNKTVSKLMFVPSTVTVASFSKVTKKITELYIWNG